MDQFTDTEKELFAVVAEGRQTRMNSSMVIQSQLLATKFFVPVASGTLISRPRLMALLDESLKHPFTLVSAPAGFGKTMLLSVWAQSQPAQTPLVAWVSLDEEDNDPQLFWTYVLSALDMHPPERFTPLLKYLQSPQAPSIKYILTALSNLLLDSPEHFVLILDDYHIITEQQVHTTLLYLLEHIPPQLHIILATRADPPLPLPLLRTRQQALEVRTEQLRCTREETRAFFEQVIGIHLPEETIQEVTTRTEGWLVGLQLLNLSLPGHADPTILLEEASGDQRYILDFLTEEVLQRQPQEVQTFLLCTSILERLTASLCDAVMEQSGSQQMLQRLEQTNLFVVSLDSKRLWYRYHALFAEALRYQLEQTQPDLMPILHHRASLWYAQHGQTTQAILHAFHANAWQRVADLIEQMSSQLAGLAWGVSPHKLTVLHQWLKQLPAEVIGSRPLLCLACGELLWTVASPSMQQVWLGTAERMLTASLAAQGQEDASPALAPEVRQEQQNLLGWLIAWRAVLQSYQQDGAAALPLCQQALSLLSVDHLGTRIHVALAQVWAYYTSVANDASAAVESGLQAASLARATGQTPLIIAMMGITVGQMLGIGRLDDVERLTQEAILLGKQPEGPPLPDVSLPLFYQAEILRERNQLDAALSLIEEAISLGEQVESLASLGSMLTGYAVLLRIRLSRGDLNAACSALQQIEHIGRSMERSLYLHTYSYFTTTDQVRLWLACGELDQATNWVEQLELAERHGTLFARERTEVARVRMLLANGQSAVALQRLEPVLKRATTGKRWSHVIEIRLLQALAHQMLHQVPQALDPLREALCLAEPEGFIRSFVEEGSPMKALLSKLREQQGKDSPTPYLDRLLAAFPSQSKLHRPQSKQSR